MMPQDFNLSPVESSSLLNSSIRFPDSCAGNGDRPESFTEEQTTMNDEWCQRLKALMEQTCAAAPNSEARRSNSVGRVSHS